MARSIMTVDQLTASHRRLDTLRLLARAAGPMTSDQVMGQYAGGQVSSPRATERKRVRSALRDLCHAAWVERSEAGWRITAGGREVLAQIDALQAAA